MSDITENTAPRYCTECGSQLQEGASFCVNCGTSVKGAEPAASAAGAEAAADAETVPGAAEAAAAAGAEIVADARVGAEADKPAEPSPYASPAVDDASTAEVPQGVDGANEASEDISLAADEPSSAEAVSDKPADAAQADGPVQSAAIAAEPLPVAAQQAGGPAKPKRTALIVAVIVIVVVVIAAICAGFFFLSDTGRMDEEDIVQEEAIDQDDPDIDLIYEYTTRWSEVSLVTYPSFTFRYPQGWYVEDADVDKLSEEVDLEKDDSDVTVQFSLDSQAGSSSRYQLINAEKVAESDFWPTAIQDTNMTRLGAFAVAELEIRSSSSKGSSEIERFYAVVPESAVNGDTSDLVLSRGIPQFDYGVSVGFYCEIPDEGMTETTREEVIAILSSFNNGSAEDDYYRVYDMYAARDASSSSSSRSAASSKDGYILEDSDSRYYSESELKDLSMYDLYLARNEIFARHGRIFSNQDLKDYFGSKSWYKGTIQPSDFSDSVLNSYEKRNIELIMEIEREGGSPYLS